MFDKKYKKALELLDTEINKTYEEHLQLLERDPRRSNNLCERFIALSELRKRFWKEIGP